jgi:predicted metal-dependent peptidase
VAADRAINHDLKGSGFKLPPGALYPSADEEGKSAEWIYARQDENQDGNGKSKPDPLGELRDAPNGPDEDGNPAPSEQDWKQKMAEALNSAKMAGKVPGGLARLVKEALRPRVDVRSLLLRFFSERSNADYSWSRPNSRYIAQGLYLPSLESSALGEIAVLCDTSGSVDETSLAYARSILEQVLDEVNPAGVTLYMVDTEVHTVHRMERGDLLTWEPKGGGGTDFSSFFETVETGDIQPVCVIGISDLYANFGETVPSVPVLWLSTTDMIAPFGETVSLPV